MTTVAIVLALAVSLVGVALFVRAVRSIVAVVRLGRPAVGRGDRPGQRWKHLLSETLGHTRMLQWNKIGVAHWFVFVAFGALFFTLITASTLFRESLPCQSETGSAPASRTARSAS